VTLLGFLAAPRSLQGSCMLYSLSCQNEPLFYCEVGGLGREIGSFCGCNNAGVGQGPGVQGTLLVELAGAVA